jgi:hypothetical protein
VLNEDKIPIRFYSDFWYTDFQSFPSWVQEELVKFLIRLQDNPLSLEILRKCEKDRKNRFGYRFCTGYRIFWILRYEQQGTFVDIDSWPIRIDILEVVEG